MPEEKEITKAEIHAMIEVHAKSVEQMAAVANSLTTIAAQQEKICTRLYNGLGKDICKGVKEAIEENEKVRNKAITDLSKIAEDVKKDVGVLKWLYGGLFGLIALAWLIVQVVQYFVRAGIPGATG